MKGKLLSVVAFLIGTSLGLFFMVYGPLQAHINDWMGW